ncbi:FAS-associated factor 1 [Condylostylus longicornis]|uniref:FAS-associated factor 1 n=1 Tax=Condylostylus longicornis TaxID=2530218 RepID=UPI00244DB934|nr:FAS-associated factor 1 [Condylostylus longicornis]
MAEDKDQILADFQSITAIDDVGEAFSHLENCNWDLMTAIQNVMPQETSPVEPMVQNDFSNSSNSNLTRWNSSGLENTFAPIPSTSSSNSNIIDLTADITPNSLKKDNKEIIFNIHFNQQVYTITLPSSASVGDLKDRIFGLTKVPICRQAIRGWPPAKIHEAQLSSTVLSSLDLSIENELILIDLTDDAYGEENFEIARRFAETFTLNIIQQPEGKSISLPFPGEKTILDVKNDIYSITDIPVRHQDWTGWPVGSNNTTTLAQSGIELQHNLILRSSANDKPKNNSKPSRSNNFVNIDSDSSDEFEDASDFNADDDFFSDSPAQPRLKHLIPDNTDDETLGSIQFVENYTQRYGEPHPVFFQGSLEDALKEACHKPARDRKLLAIYLHHDDSVLTNVFCDQLLRCESVMQTLMQSFILYGWDLTHESNKNLFLSSISACVGVTASITVRNIPVDRLPAIIIIAKSRSTCEVLSVINGNVGVDDLLSRLMETVEMYSEHIRVEVREETERALREQVKYEQDMAYQQTLEADMAKEAAKKQKELALAAERKRLESEKAEQEAKKEIVRLQAENALPDEPNESITENVTKIRIRTPQGENLERRFYGHDKLQALLNYVTSKGFPVGEYKVISGWPRKDLTTINPTETFKSLNLFPQETVILEER